MSVCVILNNFILKKFRHTESLQEYYNEIHLDLPTNILTHLSFSIFSLTHTSIHILLIFIIPFRS